MKAILFLIYLFVEVAISLSFAYAIGILYTFLEILLSAIFGAVILFNTPFKLQESFQRITMNKISLSAVSLAATIRVLGSFLLILPGFFGDMVGAILLIMSAILFIGNKISRGKNNEKDDEDIIDVEIIDSPRH
ncbi:MAG: FxsA family protein [Campylobacteraceae bacterium]|jgi:UPF0716 protein FxsA|nr:FxsA family protein [Campylobacteraceae bacterium]